MPAYKFQHNLEPPKRNGSNRPATRSAFFQPTIRSTTFSISAAIMSLPLTIALMSSRPCYTAQKHAFMDAH
jgi:hypothetical protein